MIAFEQQQQLSITAGTRPVMTATTDPVLQAQWEQSLYALTKAINRKDRRVVEHKLKKLAYKISKHHAANSGTDQPS